MPVSTFQLEHLNLPARDPEGLARWYEQTFGLKADSNKVRGPGVLIVFQPGEPVSRAPDLHFGLKLSSMAELNEWASKFNVKITIGGEYNAFRTFDPEGNCVELYCKATA
ncbi:MAG: VOC family protein [Betaproteobacteria bacterium]|nr:VOC family protein [Betaproteobacteria bacterium]